MALKNRILIGASTLSIFFCELVFSQETLIAKKINNAIENGVAYLKDYSEAGEKGIKRPASWALRGWALLEAGVPADDRSVTTISEYVRRSVPEIGQVYDAALSIIFLDKVGDPADDPLIESLAVRLMASQSDMGGWIYGTDVLNQAEKSRLSKLILNAEESRRQGLALHVRQRTPVEIEQDIGRQVEAIQRRALDFRGDNSNTQFAMMAIWVAKRHGTPIVQSLAKIERRFQVSQAKSGAWGYQFPEKAPPEDDNHYSHPAMTCAGLLGLALGQGVKANPKNLLEDAQVQRGLDVVGKAITGTPAAKPSNFNYFLFSMERMAVVYNLKKIAGEDWYLWGAQKLVDRQAADGSWSSGFERDAADTCFALLFLKRAMLPAI